MKSAHVLVWFRRNLRLHDNARLMPPLQAVCHITCVWVSQRPSENHNPRVKACSIIETAQELHTRLAAHHIPLYVVASDEDLLPLAAAPMPIPSSQTKPTQAEIRQDNHLWHNFDQAGIALQHANDRGIFGQIPSWMPTACPTPILPPINKHGCRLIQDKGRLKPNCLFKSGQNVPLFPASTGADCLAYQQSGETAALTQWHAFKQNLVHYPITQNFPARKTPASSMPYLSAGCISPRLLRRKLGKPTFRWLDKLIFRDYCYQLAYHRRLPETTDAAPVREYWRHGQTGVPIIDASIRGLEATGHPHPVLQQLCAHYFCHALASTQPRHRVDSLRPNWHRPCAQPSQPGTLPPKPRPPSAMPTVRTKSTPTAKSAVTSPIGAPAVHPHPRREPPPTTSTHGYPFPRPSETYVHTKKPH